MAEEFKEYVSPAGSCFQAKSLPDVVQAKALGLLPPNLYTACDASVLDSIVLRFYFAP
jgi:hypothetical protein